MEAFLVLLSCFLNEPSAGKPVALVDEISGAVTIERREGPAGRPIKIVVAEKKLEYLHAGDTLTVEKGHVVLVFFRDDHSEDLGHGTYTVEVAGCRGNPGSAPLNSPAAGSGDRNMVAQNDRGSFGKNTDLEWWDALKTGTGRTGGLSLRGRVESPPSVVPLYEESVTTDRPGLTWPSVPKAKDYVIELHRGGSGRLVWKAETSACHLDYPADQPPLTRARRYVWKVLARSNEGGERPLVESTFSVTRAWSPDELARLRRLATSNSPAGVLKALAIYKSNRMLSPALAASKRLVELVPNDPDAWRTLSEFYAQAGRLDEARKAAAKASQLPDHRR
jgi:hypothetical protein